MTDCPTQQANSDAAVRHRERDQWRISVKEQEYVKEQLYDCSLHL